MFRLEVLSRVLSCANDQPRNKQAKDQKAQRNYDLICAHELQIGARPAISSLGCRQKAATCRANSPVFSAYIPLCAQSGSLSSPKQEDLKWLTTIFQSRHQTGPTAFRLIAGQALEASRLSLRASLSCLLCCMRFLAVSQQKIQTKRQPLPLKKLFQQFPLNNTQDHHSPQKAGGALCAFGFSVFGSTTSSKVSQC